LGRFGKSGQGGKGNAVKKGRSPLVKSSVTLLPRKGPKKKPWEDL